MRRARCLKHSIEGSAHSQSQASAGLAPEGECFLRFGLSLVPALPPSVVPLLVFLHLVTEMIFSGTDDVQPDY